MSKTIAVAGKGGVGKTTLTGLMIQYLTGHGKRPVLAVDADANSNLNEVLGVDVEMTLGQIREVVETAEMNRDNPIPAGMSKADYMEWMFQSSQFNGDISQWNVSNVISTAYMFQSSQFSQNISNWDMPAINRFKRMFDMCPIPNDYKPKPMRS